MPDKIKQITNILNTIVKDANKAKKLLAGCEDTCQLVVAYTRAELNDQLGRESTDDEWESAWGAIHNDDTAWSYMSDACYSAECSLDEEK